MSRRPARLLAALAGAGLLAGGVSACGTDNGSVAEQAKAGDRKGYIAGDGQLRVYAPAERGEPVSLAGETLDGGTWQASDHRGKVVVVNLWASWCGPCAKEAPDLVAAHEQTTKASSDVEFVGIDYREPSIETGRAQAKAWGFTYPSITDQSGQSAISMQGKMTTQPSTAVLDRQGRIAAVMPGVITRSTLVGLVEDTLAEKAG